MTLTATIQRRPDDALEIVSRERMSAAPILITRRWVVEVWKGRVEAGDTVTSGIGEDGWSNGRCQLWTEETATITETPIAQPPGKVWRDGGWVRKGAL